MNAPKRVYFSVQWADGVRAAVAAEHGETLDEQGARRVVAAAAQAFGAKAGDVAANVMDALSLGRVPFDPLLRADASDALSRFPPVLSAVRLSLLG